MSEPFVGEIILCGFNFAPTGWALCNGQLLPIAQYDTLFNLIGTTYGGDGQTTFALPDLRGRVPLGQGQGPSLQNRTIGEFAGNEAVTLTVPQLPSHTHPIDTSAFSATTKCKNGPGNQATPVGNVHATEAAGATMVYSNAVANATMNAETATVSGAVTVAPTGGSTAHGNMQPFLTMNFCISLFGIFPSQS
jgi:microcystin-dependent protein